MNYVWVGAFVLVLGCAFIAGVLWLASGGAWQKQYDLYLATEDESVAGLNLNAPVKFNGVDVGRVRSIELDRQKPERVNLMLALEHGTPVKVDTVAVLRIQGLTGIAYVELSGGAHASPLLTATEGSPWPVIQTKPSLSARLENVLTSVLAKLDSTSTHINALLSEDNRKAVSSTLADIAVVARTIAARKSSIDTVIVQAAQTFEQTAQVSAQAGPVIERIGRSADAIGTMGQEVARTSVGAGKTVETVGADLQRFGAETMPELQRLMGELGVLSASLRRLTEQTERDPRGLLFGRHPAPPGPGETASTGKASTP